MSIILSEYLASAAYNEQGLIGEQIEIKDDSHGQDKYIYIEPSTHDFLMHSEGPSVEVVSTLPYSHTTTVSFLQERPKPKPRIVNPFVNSSYSVQPSEDMNNYSLSDSIRKRGRPRIHPQKDLSIRRPRGRPRLTPLTGEDAWKSECLKLRRLVKKKDELILVLKQRLIDLGQPPEEFVQDVVEVDNYGYHIEITDENGDEGAESDASLTMETAAEHNHQNYINMFGPHDNATDNSSENDENSRSYES